MIDIHTRSVELQCVAMSIEQMDAIMNDGIIDNEYFIPFHFECGKKGSVKKSEICAYHETIEEDIC